MASKYPTFTDKPDLDVVCDSAIFKINISNVNAGHGDFGCYPFFETHSVTGSINKNFTRTTIPSGWKDWVKTSDTKKYFVVGHRGYQTAYGGNGICSHSENGDGTRVYTINSTNSTCSITYRVQFNQSIPLFSNEAYCGEHLTIEVKDGLKMSPNIKHKIGVKYTDPISGIIYRSGLDETDEFTQDAPFFAGSSAGSIPLPIEWFKGDAAYQANPATGVPPISGFASSDRVEGCLLYFQTFYRTENNPYDDELGETKIARVFTLYAPRGDEYNPAVDAIELKNIPDPKIETAEIPAANKQKLQNMFIQNKSNVSIVANNIYAKYNASIAAVEVKRYTENNGIKANEKIYDVKGLVQYDENKVGSLKGVDGVSDYVVELPTAGDTFFEVSVTDSRGRTTTRRQGFHARPYYLPTITRIKANRCGLNEAGALVRKEDGDRIEALVYCTYAGLHADDSTGHINYQDPLNQVVLRYYWEHSGLRETDTDEEGNETNIIGNKQEDPNLPASIVAVDAKNAGRLDPKVSEYTFVVTAQDIFGMVEENRVVESSNFLMYFGAKGSSVSFGTQQQRDNTVLVNGDWDLMLGNVNVLDVLKRVPVVIYSVDEPLYLDEASKTPLVDGAIWLKPVAAEK